ncbi:MAG: ThuA domain-containing protein [Cyclobacteriaceae bacterium]|nr:ThuA domain-containing protein [Cyclobacteriaceae bacterium]
MKYTSTTSPYSRENVRVLLSVNKEKTDMGPQRRFLPERKLDSDFPVSWIRQYGRGRVFNTSLGHHPHINWDPRILDHNFRAIQYILGDLPAPSTPSAKLTSAIIAQEKAGLAAWAYGLFIQGQYAFSKPSTKRRNWASGISTG